MLIENDSIYVIGYFKDTISPFKTGLHFSVLDTLGNPIQTVKHFAANGEYWAATYHQPFIKLKNQPGFAVLGNFYGEQRGYLLRLDEQGQFLWLKSYPKPATAFTNAWLFLKETETGFLAGVDRQLENYDKAMYLNKLDHNGNVIWEKEMDTPAPARDIITDIMVRNENEYVMAGAIINSNNNVQLVTVRPVLYGIDSTGALIWEREGEPGLSESSVLNLQAMENGDWVYATATSYLYLPGQAFFSQMKLVRRNANFDLVWEQTYGPPNSDLNTNRFFEAAPHPQGGYVGVGTLQNYGEEEQGYIIRTDSEGVLQWERFDMAASNEKWTAVDFLSSGSIIACGQTDNFQVGKTYAWLIKMSPDGCVDTLNCATVEVTEEQPTDLRFQSLQVFPNPASDLLHLQSDVALVRSTLSGIDGRLVAAWEGDQRQLDVSQAPQGIYVLRVLAENGAVARHLVQIVR
jgi:outer membrane protein assembly factor BamB